MEKGEGYTRRWNIHRDGANTEWRLNREGTTKRGERGYIRIRRGNQTEKGEGVYTERKQTRRGDYTERRSHGERRGINTEKKNTRVNNHIILFQMNPLFILTNYTIFSKILCLIQGGNG